MIMSGGVEAAPPTMDECMMKKLIPSVLSLIMIAGMTVNAAAAEFTVTADSEVIAAGEQITLTIVLDETIPVSESITNVQGELHYDTELFSYTSHEMGGEYAQYMSKDMPNKNRFQFSHTSMTSSPYEIPAGNVLTITFTAKETIPAEAVESVFQLKMKTTTDTAETKSNEAQLNVSLSGGSGSSSAAKPEEDTAKPDNTPAETPEKTPAENVAPKEETAVTVPVPPPAEAVKPADSPSVNAAEKTEQKTENKQESAEQPAVKEEEKSPVTSEKKGETSPKAETSQNNTEEQEAEDSRLPLALCAGAITVLFAAALWLLKRKQQHP